MIDAQVWREDLGLVLGRLASTSEEQNQYLAELGVAGSLDELALEFDDRYRPLASVLELLPRGPETLRQLQAVDGALKSETLGWGFEDIGSREWVANRVLAQRAREALARL